MVGDIGWGAGGCGVGGVGMCQVALVILKECCDGRGGVDYSVSVGCGVLWCGWGQREVVVVS